MKYLITESKLNRAIHDYLDEMIPEDEMEIHSPLDYDDDGNEVYDKCRILFTIGDMNDGEAAFRYYDKCYWSEKAPNYLRLLELLETYNPPYLDIEQPFGNLLRGMFGNHLDEPFKEWFTNRYKLPLNKIG